VARVKTTSAGTTNGGATVGYEARLLQMADALRGSMDADEYKHVVLGLIFLKYISDAFEEQHARLVAEQAQGASPEDPDEYRALSIFQALEAIGVLAGEKIGREVIYKNPALLEVLAS
jgi:type I restriction enzyme M protein